ncbi:hypothetical protein [Flavonifractor sp. An306]|uniref:hypothetical protein n=1 Tax=Flavonifractor sp. An306 TaxID=1965629 RepID=UPI000B3725A1|nr:hypothetical protein [Flavonifractor sp. An306]OUO36404.1 hypothetical protein B5F88_13880 [Flavonifractor sp. An306]
MDYKHSCVVDINSIYKTLVLVLLEEHQGWVTQNYTLAEGEQLIDTAPPIMRPHAGAAGFVSPKWDSDTSAWIEAATEEEVEAWEAEHPAPDLPEKVPTAEERLTALEGAILAMMGVRTDV